MDYKKVAVIGERSYSGAIKDHGDIIYTDEFLKDPKQCKLVLFTGGPDVDPATYNNSSPAGLCRFMKARDLRDMEVLSAAMVEGIKMTGICRGAQFLHVMAGGPLIHHMNGHDYKNHKFGCMENDKIIDINSSHHQMMVPFGGCHVIGWSDFQESNLYIGDKDKEINYTGPEVEAAIWPDLNAVGVQYHPEWMPTTSDGSKWFSTLIDDFMNISMDDLVKKYMGKLPKEETQT